MVSLTEPSGTPSSFVINAFVLNDGYVYWRCCFISRRKQNVIDLRLAMLTKSRKNCRIGWEILRPRKRPLGTPSIGTLIGFAERSLGVVWEVTFSTMNIQEIVFPSLLLGATPFRGKNICKCSFRRLVIDLVEQTASSITFLPIYTLNFCPFFSSQAQAIPTNKIIDPIVSFRILCRF